ncbi:MAG: ribosome maturation factor RimP [Aminivibrio sp.]|jgi:ribosome maturation factor RimP|nr:ribosome maturation factor RimP [Synergistaceae bacterium]
MSEKKSRENFGELREIVERLGYESVGITLSSEGNRSILRVFIDSLGGILVKDCEIVSREMNRFLDEYPEYIRGQYYLEVSSPGIERPLFTLKDYERFTGKKIKIKTSGEVDGQKRFTGLLKGVEEGGVILLERDTGRGPEEGDDIRIPFNIITKGNLAFDEEEEKRRSS